MVRKIHEKSNHKVSNDLKSKYKWLPNEYQVVVIDDPHLDAFTFTLVRKIGLRLKAENWIIVTYGLLEILNEEELEMVLAHEFSHTYEYDTRYAHLIYTIAAIVFFDPMLRLFKYLINDNHEYQADLHAVKLINRPRTLANALFKMLKEQININKRRISTGIISGKKPLILKRIEKLLEYAEQNNIDS
jgi:Zn-dependent protease with chaperone function